MPLDEPAVQRIYLVRQMLAEGLDTVSDALPFGRMRCVLLLDLAVDTVLATILATLGAPTKHDEPLPKKLGDLCARQPSLVSHKTRILRFHELRNTVQHDGFAPSAEDLRQMRAQVEIFIRDATREVTAQELEQISPASLVSSEGAREHLHKAEQAVASSDYKIATTEAAIGFAIGWQHMATKPFQWGEAGKSIADGVAGAVARAAKLVGDAAIQQFATSLQRELQNAVELKTLLLSERHYLEVQVLGVNVSAYWRFRQVTPIVWLDANSTPRVWDVRQHTPTQADALFALDFATTTLLQLQARMAAAQPSTEGPSQA